jgi:hypothetical protein
MRRPRSAGPIALRYHADKHDDVTPRSNGFSPEFLLTAACCRWPPSESRNAAIRSAAADGIRWEEFLRVVRRHRVGGLVQDAMLSAGIDCPPLIAETMARQSRRIIRRNLTSATEAVRLQRAFESAGIPALVLKGAALAQLAYGSFKTKHARDIDFLVSPERAEAALRLLERESYTLLSPAKYLSEPQRQAVVRYAREVELVRRDKRLRVELQWRVASNPLLLKGVAAYSASQSVTLSDGVTVRTLGADDLFAYLCVHGANHSWSRLKWLADVNALLAAGNADIARLYRHAQNIGAGLCAGQTLLLCRRLFDLRLPAALAQEIQANERVARLTTIGFAAMTAPQAETETDGGFLGVMRAVRTQFLLGQGWDFFLAQCRVQSVKALDVVDLPLPPPLRFLYPLLRLPLWLWRRARWALNRQKRAS